MSDVVDTKRIGFTFIWKIENFSLVPRFCRRSAIKSATFIADNLGKTCWFLELEPFGYYVTNKQAFAFRLVKSQLSGPDTICLDYELSVLFHGNSKVKFVTKCAEQFQLDTPRGRPLHLTPHEIFSKREVLPGDILTVQCKMWYNKGHCLDPGFCLSRIRIGAERKTFIWPIDNFSKLEMNDSKSVSVDFQTNMNLSLIIVLFLTVTYGERIRIKVAGENNGESDLIITLEIAVQNVDRKSTYYAEDDIKLPIGHREHTFPLILEKHSFTRKPGYFLPNNVLSLKCVFTVTKFRSCDAITLNEIERTTYGIDAVHDLKEATKNLYLLKNTVHSKFSSLENDMNHLFESQYLADINIKVQKEVFPAHKAILGARSSVFKTMFETDMKEKITNTIEIEDFEPDTIKLLLLYMYSDYSISFDNITTQNLTNLCLAAEKYDIVSLKKTCLSVLENRISLRSICSTLVLADALKVKELMNSAVDFIQNNSDVMNCSDWKKFCIEHPQLAIEILTRLFRNK